MASALMAWLVENDPKNASVYSSNYQNFVERHQQALLLDGDIKNWHYYTYHNAFEYLFKPLGLQVEGSLTTNSEAGVGMRSLFDIKQRIANQADYCVLVPQNAEQKTRKQLGVDVVAIDMLASRGEYNHFSDYLKSMIKTIQTCH
jgi:ABC-type Zn2+ transport system substrate-binding protein/surface adhesin